MRILKFALLDLAYDIDAIEKEVGKLVDSQYWQPHYNLHDYEGEWTVISLRSSGGYQNGYADALNGEGYADTPLMDMVPSVKKLADSLACEKGSIRLLRLAPGAVVGEHRDLELYFEKGEARLHFPIVTNPGVEFFVEDNRVYMRRGECWYLNANLPHRLRNSGNTGRIHLVVDCIVNDWLCDYFERHCILKDEITEDEITYRNKQNIERTIEELKRQGDNPVARQLVAKLEAQLHVALAYAQGKQINTPCSPEEVLDRLTGFIRSIGIDIKESCLTTSTFLPGILIENGHIVFDRERLQYPGDLLHEAGHIAVSPGDHRSILNEMSITTSKQREAEEMMAIAWSYAACKHLNLPPSIVFHEGGYRGGSQSIIDNFEQGHFFGTSMLQWCGMTRQPPPQSMAVDCFPRMIKWMRD